MLTQRDYEFHGDAVRALEEMQPKPSEASGPARNTDTEPTAGKEAGPQLVETPSGWKVAAGLPGLLTTALANVTRGRPKGEGERRLNFHAPQMLVMLSDIATMAETPDDAVERLRLIAKMARKTVADATGVEVAANSREGDS